MTICGAVLKSFGLNTYTHLNKINITRPKNYSVINIIALNVENFEGKYDYAKKHLLFSSINNVNIVLHVSAQARY